MRRIRTQTQRSQARRRTLTAAFASFILLVVGALVAPTTTILASASTPSGAGLFSDSVRPENPTTTDTTSVNLGVRFKSDEPGSVVALQFYRSELQKKAYTASLWDLDGRLLSQTTFPASSTAGWQTAELPEPVKVNKGRWYVASYLASDGQYVSTDNVFPSDWKKGPLSARKHGGTKAESSKVELPKSAPKGERGTSYLVDLVFEARSNQDPAPTPEPTKAPAPKPTPTQSEAPSPSPEPTESEAPEPKPEPTPTQSEAPEPTPTQSEAPEPTPTQSEVPSPSPEPTPTPSVPAQPSPGEWPNASNTGVPSGVSLTTYSGPLTITEDNTVIREKIVNGTLRIQASNVQIINSRINGGVDLRSPRSNDYSFSIVDSEVHIGDNLNTGLMRGNFEANRVEITGGRRSVYCESNCTIENSWVHSQGGDPGGDAHFSGIRMGEDTTIIGNTITCEAQRGSGTGCSAGLTGYGDFGPVQRNLIQGNYFTGGGGGGSTMCAYGGSSGDDGSKPYGHLANNIRFIDNVFARGESGVCGNLGSIRSFDPTRPGNVWSGNTWDDGTPISYNGR